jgi:hypothetical protein
MSLYVNSGKKIQNNVNTQQTSAPPSKIDDFSQCYQSHQPNSSTTQQYMDLDPVQSYIRMDRCGPNPNPEWCYILKTNLCNYRKY